ncbi:hypothetical protein HYW20_04280, partial [Candidatus Woesearchaeota archaeon]|nr:hypothetical protein [Candidatus Woesearchaeota archaeon]
MQANTLYHYRAKSKDAAGLLATSGDFTFTTLSSAAISNGDVNGDNKVDVNDILFITKDFGKSSGYDPKADVAAPFGVINIYDVMAVVMNWGKDYASSVDTSLVGYWKFDEGSGTTAADSAGTNTGTLINGPIWTAGKIGGALNFDGADDFVNVGSASSLDDLKAYTVCAWINPRSGGENNNGRIVTKAPGTNVGGAQLMMMSASSFGLRERNTLGTGFTIQMTMPLNEWQHVCGSYNDNGDRVLRVYRNGLQGGTTATLTGTLQEWASYDMMIGGNDNTDRAFNGL